MISSMSAKEFSRKPKNGPRRVSIFGSTGSVGINTLELISDSIEEFQVEVLTANENVSLLAEQARAVGAKLAVVANEAYYGQLKDLLDDTEIEIAAGQDALTLAGSREVDWVMAAIVGAAGLAPTLAAIQTGAIIALANKESLVCGGALVLDNVRKYGATLLPVDSEHNAIFQVLDFNQLNNVSRLILTASGGPFLDLDYEEMRLVSREQALAHPNWDMGAKISIDSATMMNKGLELIEAAHLFPIPPDQIDILVHPQSIIHSMVEYKDGSVLSQMGSPDMKTPISYTLGWPDRHPFTADRLDLAKIGSLTFLNPDPIRFPALNLARNALKTGKSAPTILNAANELAVEGFLEGKLGFLDICSVVEETLQQSKIIELNSIEEIIDADRSGRALARSIVKQFA
ncbi:1-deoxy-D-xylulose-5-phosphate reductoisomerase [Sneathiella marina]|uniref:1-deoxy-D-xylulose 5-phosphate reductoisomerase n=1 Tax=Sneathiella marina TaxID=2950108 RepID=A0ABY4W2T5_9PROT|nr:1-deoxy-D-xylulose-5-phosphate reductoisomerase [Sneathiella marina]USG59614.1 1-deoxy-D-xylulose-5-phosphate reductoisomerase [Sneathiella marina]